MKLVVTAKAEASIRQAVSWYQKQVSLSFAHEVVEAFEQALNDLTKKPLLYAEYVEVSPVRRMVMTRFPYLLFFIIEADSVVILDVLHSSQKRPDSNLLPQGIKIT